ncbi:MAG TPA: hypothetical protein VK908_17340 [Jiangellales bacterium]|nr:hypothetical protein [Jiangellales bacterium]
MEHSHPDRLVVETVAHVRDRFGIDGLRDLVELATRELRRTEQALQGLAEPAERVLSDAGAGEPDTQTWQAYVEEGEDDERA